MKALPLSYRVLGSHGRIATGAYRLQIVQARPASLTLGYIVTHVIVEDVYGVRAPPDVAVMLEGLAEILDPYLLSQRFGYAFLPHFC